MKLDNGSGGFDRSIKSFDTLLDGGNEYIERLRLVNYAFEVCQWSLAGFKAYWHYSLIFDWS